MWIKKKKGSLSKALIEQVDYTAMITSIYEFNGTEIKIYPNPAAWAMPAFLALSDKKIAA